MNLIPWLSQRSVSTSAKTWLQRTGNSSLSSRKSLHVGVYELLDSSTGLESPKFSLQRALRRVTTVKSKSLRHQLRIPGCTYAHSMDSVSEKISRTSARIAMAGRLDQCDAHQLEPFKLALVKTELELCVGRRLLSGV